MGSCRARGDAAPFMGLRELAIDELPVKTRLIRHPLTVLLWGNRLRQFSGLREDTACCYAAAAPWISGHTSRAISAPVTVVPACRSQAAAHVVEDHSSLWWFKVRAGLLPRGLKSTEASIGVRDPQKFGPFSCLMRLQEATCHR